LFLGDPFLAAGRQRPRRPEAQALAKGRDGKFRRLPACRHRPIPAVPESVSKLKSAPLVQTTQTAPWAAELLRRIRYQLLLKTLAISAFMWVFFAAYFHLLRHPVHTVMVMPLTALDRAIPFQPGAIVAYVSLWFYVGIPPGLMLNLRDALVYGLWIGGLCLVGLTFFYIVPTAVPPFELGADVTRHAGFSLLQGVDAAGNACPSLHVATAVFTAVWMHRLLQITRAPTGAFVFNALWLAFIVYSTLAIKQHVVLDALAGMLLGLSFAWPSRRWGPRGLR
jgi:hypothetical protein